MLITLSHGKLLQAMSGGAQLCPEYKAWLPYSDYNVLTSWKISHATRRSSRCENSQYIRTCSWHTCILSLTVIFTDVISMGKRLCSPPKVSQGEPHIETPPSQFKKCHKVQQIAQKIVCLISSRCPLSSTFRASWCLHHYLVGFPVLTQSMF